MRGGAGNHNEVKELDRQVRTVDSCLYTICGRGANAMPVQRFMD